MGFENYTNELETYETKEDNIDGLVLQENIMTNIKLGDLEKEIQDDIQSNLTIEDQEKQKTIVQQLDSFFTKNNLYKEWSRKEDLEENKKYNARFSFVQYLHYLGIKLFKTSEYLETEKEGNDRGKRLVERSKKEGWRDGDKYKNGLSAYHGGGHQNQILLDFIKKNENKSVINGVKLPGGKKLSALCKPIERK